MLRIIPLSDAQELITRKAVRLAEAEGVVAPILEEVRRRGDEALFEYARHFDGFSGTDVRVPVSELDSAAAQVSPEFRSALKTAAANIAEYARLRVCWRDTPRAGVLTR